MVEIKTKYTLEKYKEYVWFSLFRGKYYRYGQAAFPFLTMLMIFYSVYSFFSLDDSDFILATAASIVCVLFYIVAFIKPKSYVKNSPSLFKTSMEIVFNDDNFSSAQIGDIASGTGLTSYEAIFKIYETKNTFYLYLSPRQAMLLTKKDIVKGTPEELRALLQAKLPLKKYVLCK